MNPPSPDLVAGLEAERLRRPPRRDRAQETGEILQQLVSILYAAITADQDAGRWAQR